LCIEARSAGHYSKKRHKNRREQCIQPHGNPGECARKRIDLERAGGADAVGSETGGEASGAFVDYVQ
jgi:hypothetical protein